MKRGEDIERIYTKKGDIERIAARLRTLRFSELKKHQHFIMSLAEKNTNEEELKNFFTQFDKIKLIIHRMRQNGFNNYNFHYVKDDGTFIIYSINVEKQPPLLINAFCADKSFSNFMKSIVNNYKNKFA